MYMLAAGVVLLLPSPNLHGWCAGALALPDIGQIFPDTDPQWQGASSDQFVRESCKLMREQGYHLGNIDCTLIAQKPKLSPHKEDIRCALETSGVQTHWICTCAALRKLCIYCAMPAKMCFSFKNPATRIRCHCIDKDAPTGASAQRPAAQVCGHLLLNCVLRLQEQPVRAAGDAQKLRQPQGQDA